MLAVPLLDADALPSLPRITIIIPAHNYGHYLGLAIESVRAQTLTDWELIVIDDGSIDDTRAVVARFTDSRLTYVWQENAGLSASRNAGLARARGEFIVFLDADDLWKPMFLESTWRKMQELGPEYGLIAAETERIGPRGEPLPLPKHRARMPFEGEITTRALCLSNRPFPSAVLLRRSLFAVCGGFNVALKSSEDRDLWIRATEHARFWFMGEPLVHIRRHPSNMSKHPERMKRNTRATLVMAYRRGAVSRLDLPFWCRAFSVHFFQIAWTHFHAGRRAASLAYLSVSVFLCPIFVAPQRFTEPTFFRLRALAHFLFDSIGEVTPPAPI